VADWKLLDPHTVEIGYCSRESGDRWCTGSRGLQSTTPAHLPPSRRRQRPQQAVKLRHRHRMSYFFIGQTAERTTRLEARLSAEYFYNLARITEIFG